MLFARQRSGKFGAEQYWETAAQGLSVVGERSISQDFIDSELRESPFIVFLGFGFLAENVALLQKNALVRERHILSSGYGVSVGQRFDLCHGFAQTCFTGFGSRTAKIREVIHDSNLFGLLSNRNITAFEQFVKGSNNSQKSNMVL